MNTEKATTPSAKKTSTKEGKNTFDFSSLYASRDYEKDLDGESFLSLIRKSSGAKNEEISKYISSNETIKELFSNSQLLTEIIYDRAEKILSSALGSAKEFPIPVRKVAQRCGFEIVEVDFQAMTDEFTWAELQKTLASQPLHECKCVKNCLMMRRVLLQAQYMSKKTLMKIQSVLLLLMNWVISSYGQSIPSASFI